jgi:glycosyltransferase involved in cell wall biosynthesis
VTVGLAMLVKDGEQTLPATLETVLPLIDAWTIIDTGSTDRSPAIIRDTLKDKPGRLLRRDFKGFGPSRTELLSEARGAADYTLMVDADHTITVTGDRPAALTADAYLVRIRSQADGWRLPLLTKNSHPFEYRGAAHAYLATDEPHVGEDTDWLTIHGGAGATREKLERDLGLLQAEFLAHPDDTRTVFYLAQTHRDLDHHEQAIFFYRLRASMTGGFEEEAHWARYQLGCLLSEHVSFAEGADELLRAWRERPTRIEALRALANAANAVADKAALPNDGLFVRIDAYRKAAA